MHSILLLTYSLVLLLRHPVSSSSPHSWRFSQLSPLASFSLSISIPPLWFMIKINTWVSNRCLCCIFTLPWERVNTWNQTSHTGLSMVLSLVGDIKRMVDNYPSPLKLGLQVEVLLDRKAVSQRHKVVHNIMPLKRVIQDGRPHHPIAKPHITRRSDLIW